MSSKNNGLSVSYGTVLSVACLLLYSAGFIRIELEFNEHDQRLMAVEEVISQMKHGMADRWEKGKVKCNSQSFSPAYRQLYRVYMHTIVLDLWLFKKELKTHPVVHNNDLRHS